MLIAAAVDGQGLIFGFFRVPILILFNAYRLQQQHPISKRVSQAGLQSSGFFSLCA